jgi:hypothetical protein
MPVILALRRLKPEDHEFKASLDYTVTPCLKKKKKKQKRKYLFSNQMPVFRIILFTSYRIIVK